MISSPENELQTVPPKGLGDVRSVVRQPILDHENRVHGYQLHFEGPPNALKSGGAVQEARTILDDAVIFGVERYTSGLPAFIPCSAEALIERWVSVLPAASTILELLGSVEVTPQLLVACHELRSGGYKLALVKVDTEPFHHPLAGLVDYIKIDLPSIATVSGRQPSGQSSAGGAAMVACKVETQEDYQMAREKGFTLFQGYYFCYPDVIRAMKMPANRLCHFDILRKLQKKPLDIATISPLVLRDVSLTYRLLRLVNSPIYSMRREITSMESAIVVLGEDTFRRIATLAILRELNAGQTPEILHMALTRARFCQLAAPLSDLDPNEQYLLGMLSLLPAMMRFPMVQLAPELPLRDEIRSALLGADIRERCLLRWAECQERNDQSALNEIVVAYGLNQQRLVQFYIDAMVWDAGDRKTL